jgi:hypothetical protein
MLPAGTPPFTVKTSLQLKSAELLLSMTQDHGVALDLRLAALLGGLYRAEGSD